LLLLVGLACAPLLILMLHTAGADRRKALGNLGEREQKLAQIARREEREVIGATRQLLLAISESASVRTRDAHRCKKWLEDVLATYPRYANLGVFSTNGELVVSALPLPKRSAKTDTDLSRVVFETRNFSIGEFILPDGAQKPSVRFGYPVLGASGEVLAVAFADLDLRWLARSQTELPAQLPPGATWTEFNRQGVILARYPRPEDWVGRTLREPALASAAYTRSNGIAETTSPDSVRAFHAFSLVPSRLGSSDMAAVLSIPRSILFADADRVLRRNLSWLTVAAALTLLLSWAGSRVLILRPVRALVRSSSRLASGDLSARSGLAHSHDELGQLALAFDHMAQALEQRELERQRAGHKLQVLSQRLVEVQETERRHIARELHDEIGQSLTAAEMNLQAALQSPDPDGLERRLEQSIQAVERVLEQVHDLSLNLRPSMLDDLGLEPALRWYTHRQSELTGMQAEFRADPLEDRLDPVIETECFRVAQEALTNVVRHARARTVKVELSRRDGHLHLKVRDNGVGFDVNALRREAVGGASLGLLSMEERASLAGGGLELNSAPGSGTEVHAWFPIKWQTGKNWSSFHE
jgi:signal transduction histidine kinase